MNKSFVKKVFFISIFSILFLSCAEKKTTEVQQEIESKINYFTYDYTISFLKDENEKIYLPQSVKDLLNKPIIKNGSFMTMGELIFPNSNIAFYNLDFYDAYSDSCLWVDDLLMDLEEERIASQLLEMENLLNEVSEPITEEKKASEIIETLVEKEVKNVDSELSHMEYGEEIFIPQIFENQSILIHGYKNNITRSFYDDLYRCYKEEKWKISSDSEELLETLETKYQNDSYIPFEKSITTNESYKLKSFNNEGYLIKEDLYSVVDDKKYIKSSLVLKYNKDKKIRESSLTEYTYKDESYSKLLYKFNKKYLYRYNNDDIPANFDYYENNVLKIRNRYTTADKYTSKIYFDGGLSVLTYYENNKPVKEIFTSADGVERVKYHEE